MDNDQLVKTAIDKENFGYLAVDTYRANHIIDRLLALIRVNTRVENPTEANFEEISRISRMCSELSNSVTDEGDTIHRIRYLTHEDVEILYALHLPAGARIQNHLNILRSRVRRDTNINIVAKDKMAKDVETMMIS